MPDLLCVVHVVYLIFLLIQEGKICLAAKPYISVEARHLPIHLLRKSLGERCRGKTGCHLLI